MAGPTRWSYEGDPSEAQRWRGAAQQELDRLEMRLQIGRLASGTFRVDLSPTAYAIGTITPWYRSVHIVAPASQASSGRGLLYFEFATSGYPVVADAGAYVGCVVGATLGVNNGAITASPGIITRKRQANLSIASLVERSFHPQLIDEPSGYSNFDGTSYHDAVFQTAAPSSPYTGLYDNEVNYQSPQVINIKPASEEALRDRETGFRIGIGYSSDGAEAVKTILLDKDLPRAAGVQRVQSDRYGERLFAVCFDFGANVHVFPLDSVNAGAIDGDLVHTAAVPFPSWAFVPGNGETESVDLPAWRVSSPDIDWRLNHLGTRACCILHEREAAAFDDAYIADPDLYYGWPATDLEGFGPTGVRNLFSSSGDDSEKYTYGRGVFEITIEITLTGTGANAFSIDLTGREVRAPRDSDRGSFLVDYAWMDVSGKCQIGDMILLDIERWYQPDESIVDPSDRWHLMVYNSDTDTVDIPWTEMNSESMWEWLYRSGRPANWEALIPGMVAAVRAQQAKIWSDLDASIAAATALWNGPDSPERNDLETTVINSHGGSFDTYLINLRSDAGLQVYYLDLDIRFIESGTAFDGYYFINPLEFYWAERSALSPTNIVYKPERFVTGAVSSFYSLRRIDGDGVETEIVAINGGAIRGVDLRTLSLAVALEYTTTVDRSLNAATDAPPATGEYAGWPNAATMPHRVIHPGVAIWIQGALAKVLAAGEDTALAAMAATDPRAALDDGYTYMPANDLSGWGSDEDLRDFMVWTLGMVTDTRDEVDRARPMNGVTVAQRNWWLAMCVNSSCAPLLLLSNPNFGWALYTSEVILRSQHVNTTFFTHPNGTWAYYDPNTVYNAHGVPDIFQEFTADNASEPSGKYITQPFISYASPLYVVLVVTHPYEFAVIRILSSITSNPRAMAAYSQMRKFVRDNGGPVPVVSNLTLDVAPVAVNIWNDFDSLTPALSGDFSLAIFDHVHLHSGTAQLDTRFIDLYNAALRGTDLEAMPEDQATVTLGGDAVFTVEWDGVEVASFYESAYRNEFLGGAAIGIDGNALSVPFGGDPPVDGGISLNYRMSRGALMPPTFSTCLMLDL